MHYYSVASVASVASMASVVSMAGWLVASKVNKNETILSFSVYNKL